MEDCPSPPNRGACTRDCGCDSRPPRPEDRSPVTGFFDGFFSAVVPREPFLSEAYRQVGFGADWDRTGRTSIGLRKPRADILNTDRFEFVVPALCLVGLSRCPSRGLVWKFVGLHSFRHRGPKRLEVCRLCRRLRSFDRRPASDRFCSDRRSRPDMGAPHLFRPSRSPSGRCRLCTRICHCRQGTRCSHRACWDGLSYDAAFIHPRELPRAYRETVFPGKTSATLRNLLVSGLVC